MNSVIVYEYEKCSTCRNAIKYLESRGVSFKRVPIVENPPSQAELGKVLAAVGGDIKKLFNTSGQLYREMKIGDLLKSPTATLSVDEAIELLSQHGKLIKRPFVVTQSGGLVGFKEGEWEKVFNTPLNQVGLEAIS